MPAKDRQELLKRFPNIFGAELEEGEYIAAWIIDETGLAAGDKHQKRALAFQQAWDRTQREGHKVLGVVVALEQGVLKVYATGQWQKRLVDVGQKRRRAEWDYVGVGDPWAEPLFEQRLSARPELQSIAEPGPLSRLSSLAEHGTSEQSQAL